MIRFIIAIMIMMYTGNAFYVDNVQEVSARHWVLNNSIEVYKGMDMAPSTGLGHIESKCYDHYCEDIFYDYNNVKYYIVGK